MSYKRFLTHYIKAAREEKKDRLASLNAEWSDDVSVLQKHIGEALNEIGYKVEEETESRSVWKGDGCTVTVEQYVTPEEQSIMIRHQKDEVQGD